MSNFFDISPHFACSCGKGGIRTPGTVTRTPHFECGPIDHSGTFPCAFCECKCTNLFFNYNYFSKYFALFLLNTSFCSDFTKYITIFVHTKMVNYGV